eukprot:29741-Pelagococcus_subviridis.AAC.1
MSASSNVAPVKSVPSYVVPVITALWKSAFARFAPSNVTRSTTAFVKLAPVKSAFNAYALDMTTSVKFVPLNDASTMSAPDNVFVLRSLPSYSHLRRSKMRSDTALACPIVFPTNARSHRSGSGSTGGRRISAREDVGVARVSDSASADAPSADATRRWSGAGAVCGTIRSREATRGSGGGEEREEASRRRRARRPIRSPRFGSIDRTRGAAARTESAEVTQRAISMMSTCDAASRPRASRSD